MALVQTSPGVICVTHLSAPSRADSATTPKEIADLLNDAEERMDDKIKVTPNDVSQQKQAMTKPGAQPAAKTAPANEAAAPAEKPVGNGRRKPGRKPGPKPAVAASRAAASSTSANPVDLIEQTLELASRAGGVAALKRLVDTLAAMREW
jgi:hypothetical protein